MAYHENQLTGKKAIINYQPAHSADMKETMADIEKAKRMLGWEPEIITFKGLKTIVTQKELLQFGV